MTTLLQKKTIQERVPIDHQDVTYKVTKQLIDNTQPQPNHNSLRTHLKVGET